MGIIKNVCFDTNTIRNLIHEEKGYPEEFKKVVDEHNVKIKIAETAWAELIEDFYDKSVSINDWRNVKDRINNFLYQDCPIQEQGYNLSVDMNTFKVKKDRKDFYNKKYWIKCWQLIYRLEKEEDLLNKMIYYYKHRPFTIRIHPDLIKPTFENNRLEWKEYIDKVKETANPDSKFDDIIEIFRIEFDKEYNLDKMLDVIYVLSRYTYLSLQKIPYNPSSKKRKNDSIDFTFLQLLSKPAIFCTEDGNFQTLVKLSNAPNADNVKNIKEVIDYYSK